MHVLGSHVLGMDTLNFRTAPNLPDFGILPLSVRVAENRGARERRSYEVSNLVRSMRQYQKKFKTIKKLH